MREINGGVVRAINQENHPCVPPSAPPPTPTPNTTQSPGVEWRELARPGLHKQLFILFSLDTVNTAFG